MTLCPKKYADEALARRSADRLTGRTGDTHTWYRCWRGSHWHVSNVDEALSVAKAEVAKPVRKWHAGPTGAVRTLVWERDDGRCVGCGILITPGMWWSMQHRVARGQGGRNTPAYLIVLCGSATSRGCHRDAEDRSAESERRGYWIRANTNPAPDPSLVPVYYAHDDAWYLLDATNPRGRTRCPAPAAVTA